MDSEKSLTVFQGKNIRKTWHNEEWFFAIVDIVEALTDSSDSKQYIKKMRQRDSVLDSNWGTICTPLEIVALDGRKRISQCTNTEGAFRLIQSIPSPKAEPFKLWLAKVGYERIQEIQNPELSQERMKQIYEQKGYSKEWIDKRLRGIAIRQDLTEEWKNRGIEKKQDFSILTGEISKATFGLTPGEYKEHKGLKQENLRDHMDDMELILTMLGEATTTRITQTRDSKQFEPLKKDAKDGGEIAGTTRKNIEQTIGKTIVSKENYLKIPESQKRLKAK